MRPYAWSDTYVAGVPEIEPDFHASIEVRNGTMTIRPRRSRTVLAEIGGVTNVDRTARSTTTVTFDDGRTVVLTRPKGCGCHGSR